ncbi:hypothetical protein EDB89DRAFT_1905593 [Lactarius sanguifluus]|nr:hypothetical protein EDB89DRAFT_1905593 [Lactarius sanguifluus]
MPCLAQIPVKLKLKFRVALLDAAAGTARCRAVDNDVGATSAPLVWEGDRKRRVRHDLALELASEVRGHRWSYARILWLSTDTVSLQDQKILLSLDGARVDEKQRIANVWHRMARSSVVGVKHVESPLPNLLEILVSVTRRDVL